MGMNHFGELDRIAKAVRPNIGVISNVGVAHIEFLGSREGILKAKCEMLAHLEKDGVAILNADNDMLQTLEGKLPQKIRWFGIENKRDFYADEIAQVGLEKTACTIHTLSLHDSYTDWQCAREYSHSGGTHGAECAFRGGGRRGAGADTGAGEGRD